MKNRRWKNIIGITGLVICLLLSLLPMPVLADTTKEQTEEAIIIPEDAIHISTAEDLLVLAENCRLNTWSIGKTIVLDNDIDMTEIGFHGIPTFGGTFLGQGYKISGINMQREGSIVGFFRYLQKTAVVDTLVLEGVFHPTGSKSIVGAIAGNNAGTIKHCAVDAEISGADKIGGIAGNNETSGVIEGCTVNGVVYGNHFVGGVVGENHGVVRNCTNEALINTTSVQNAVDIEDVTLNSLVNSESANTTTDIGGIVGISSGVIRECVNKGKTGYRSMGYNVGGIVGTQNGYVVDCANHAKVEGRKEVGGIVGHMEPNIVINFDTDSLQQLSSQVDGLSSSVSSLKGSIDEGTGNVNNQIEGLEEDVQNVQNAIEVLGESVKPEDGKVDKDKITAATNDLSDSINDLYTESNKVQQSAESSAQNISNQLDAVNAKLAAIEATISNMEDGLKVEAEDISGDDTEEDILGKVANCINYGEIAGNMNIGGIAGVMAEENDLDDYSDTTIYGDTSFNVKSQVRVVVRDCKNFGKVRVNKLYGGGIVGYMLLGAVIESVNGGDLDAISKN